MDDDGCCGGGAGNAVTPPMGRACRHCSAPVTRDADGRWIHASQSYACRDTWGAVASTTAEPGPPRPRYGKAG